MSPQADIARVDSLRAEAQVLARRGSLSAALAKFEEALSLAPLDTELMADLADVAGRMGMHQAALALWGRLLEVEPDRLQAYDGFARALRDLHRYDEAINLLQQVIPEHQDDGRLWNTLGTVLNQAGRTEQAIAFFAQSATLDPASAVARYNLGGARFDLGDLDGAERDLDAALQLSADARHHAMITFAIGLLRLSQGRLEEGWDAYAVRLSPAYEKFVQFDAPGRAWTEGEPLAGLRLLVLAEQGLGDEVMFANVLPDVIEAVGQSSQVTAAVAPRLVALFARSFPKARIIAHATDKPADRPVRSAPGATDADAWAPLASLAGHFRRNTADFPGQGAYLTPDPERVAHWRRWLGDQPAAGLSWRSGKLSGERRRLYPPIEALGPILATPGPRLVNVQYDVEPAELEALGRMAGRPILQPPGLDLRNDLDDLAALCVALDRVISVANATAQIAGACGARLGILSPPAMWPMLGTEGYPWYPAARVFVAPRPGEWDPPLQAAARWLREP
jgi:Flp pilus assembly protein TadD